MKQIKSLEELRDYINSNEDWMLEVNEVIVANDWTDETGEKYGICNDGKNRLQFDGEMNAEIVELGL